jgi:hypothetical protein
VLPMEYCRDPDLSMLDCGAAPHPWRVMLW